MKKLLLGLLSILLLLGVSACASSDEISVKTNIDKEEEVVTLTIKNNTKQTVTNLKGAAIYWGDKSDSVEDALGSSSFEYEGTLKPGEEVEIEFYPSSASLSTYTYSYEGDNKEDCYQYETETIGCDFASIKKVGYMIADSTLLGNE